MPIRWMLLLLWLLPVFFLADTSAIAAASSDSPFIIDSWSAEDGLPDNEAISLLQAKDGYLWIGTPHGLVRFDGNQFTVFDEMNTNTSALKSDCITFLYEDKQTNLWIGTQSAGLAMIQNGKLTSFEDQTGKSGSLTGASEDIGELLFYSEKGIARYKDGKMNFYPNFYSPQLYLLAAHLDVPSKDGGLWQLWNGAVLKSNGSHIVKNFGSCPWKAQITAACEDNATNLIVGTLGEGIFWFDS